MGMLSEFLRKKAMLTPYGEVVPKHMAYKDLLAIDPRLKVSIPEPRGKIGIKLEPAVHAQFLNKHPELTRNWATLDPTWISNYMRFRKPTQHKDAYDFLNWAYSSQKTKLPPSDAWREYVASKAAVGAPAHEASVPEGVLRERLANFRKGVGDPAAADAILDLPSRSLSESGELQHLRGKDLFGVTDSPCWGNQCVSAYYAPASASAEAQTRATGGKYNTGYGSGGDAFVSYRPAGAPYKNTMFRFKRPADADPTDMTKWTLAEARGRSNTPTGMSADEINALFKPHGAAIPDKYQGAPSVRAPVTYLPDINMDTAQKNPEEYRKQWIKRMATKDPASYRHLYHALKRYGPQWGVGDFGKALAEAPTPEDLSWVEAVWPAYEQSKQMRGTPRYEKELQPFLDAHRAKQARRLTRTVPVNGGLEIETPSWARAPYPSPVNEEKVENQRGYRAVRPRSIQSRADEARAKWFARSFEQPEPVSSAQVSSSVGTPSSFDKIRQWEADKWARLGKASPRLGAFVRGAGQVVKGVGSIPGAAVLSVGDILSKGLTTPDYDTKEGPVDYSKESFGGNVAAHAEDAARRSRTPWGGAWTGLTDPVGYIGGVGKTIADTGSALYDAYRPR